MSAKRPFTIRKLASTDEFEAAMKNENLNLPISEDMSIFNQPICRGDLHLHNAMCVNPLEGADCEKDGSPSAVTFNRYENLINGGPGIVWFEATAFTPDGKSNIHQMALNKESMPGIKALVAHVDQLSVEKYGFKPYKVLQLSHAGRAARDEHSQPIPIAAFKNPVIDEFYPNLKIVTDAFIENLEDAYADAAVLAKECGFDAVDLKCCHNYIQHEFVAAFTRKGKYGGSFENRTRFLRNVIDKIRLRCGRDLDLAVRLNAYDCMPYPYGFGMVKQDGVLKEDLTETIALMQMLKDKGVSLFSISSMLPRVSPRETTFRAAFDESIDFDPFRGVTDLMNATRTLKEKFPDSVLVCAGLSWFERFAAPIASGCIQEGWFDVAGFGRSLLADPNFFKNIRAGKLPNPDRACYSCNCCFQLLFESYPAACGIFDEPYQPILKELLKKIYG